MVIRGSPNILLENTLYTLWPVSREFYTERIHIHINYLHLNQLFAGISLRPTYYVSHYQHFYYSLYCHHSTSSIARMSSYYFTVIGTRDNPLYELEFSSFKSSSSGSSHPGQSNFSTKVKELLPFITNASLDLIEDAQWSTGAFNLGRVDSFYGIRVSAFVTQGNIKFVLCYDATSSSTGGLDSMMTSSNSSKHDENVIKQFFTEAYDLYVQTLLNPFYLVNDPIVSPDFDFRLKLLARKYL